MRRSFQKAMEDEFRKVVEGATGRKVIAYMSSIHVDPDMAIELFVLEPRDVADHEPPSIEEREPNGHRDGDGPAS